MLQPRWLEFNACERVYFAVVVSQDSSGCWVLSGLLPHPSRRITVVYIYIYIYLYVNKLTLCMHKDLYICAKGALARYVEALSTYARA